MIATLRSGADRTAARLTLLAIAALTLMLFSGCAVGNGQTLAIAAPMAAAKASSALSASGIQHGSYGLAGLSRRCRPAVDRSM